jgi:hypothetical protein
VRLLDQQSNSFSDNQSIKSNQINQSTINQQARRRAERDELPDALAANSSLTKIKQHQQEISTVLINLIFFPALFAGWCEHL